MGPSDSTHELASEGFVEREVTDGQKVGSSFKCQVGDLLILRGGEKLCVRGESAVQSRGMCAFVSVYQTTTRKD